MHRDVLVRLLAGADVEKVLYGLQVCLLAALCIFLGDRSRGADPDTAVFLQDRRKRCDKAPARGGNLQNTFFSLKGDRQPV